MKLVSSIFIRFSSNLEFHQQIPLTVATTAGSYISIISDNGGNVTRCGDKLQRENILRFVRVYFLRDQSQLQYCGVGTVMFIDPAQRPLDSYI